MDKVGGTLRLRVAEKRTRLSLDQLLHLGFPLPTNADAPPVRKVCHNAMFFVPLGLALNEKRIPQTTENTEGSK